MIQKMFVYLISFIILAGCVDFTDADEPSEPTGSTITGTKQIVIDLVYDLDNSGNANAEKGNVYVMWLENSAGVKQHLFVSKKLLHGGITNHTKVLPYWHLNKYPEGNWIDSRSEIDSVTGATIALTSFTFPDDFTNLSSGTIANTISSDLGDVFTLYVEMDQSCQFNDWFSPALIGTSNYTDQDEPAVLYSVEIDLSQPSGTEFVLAEVGWTPHVEFANFTLSGGSVATLTAGDKIDEMEYITHSKNGDVFGNEKLSCSSTSLIDSIKATVSDIP